MTLQTLVFRYATFAALATFVNLLIQRIILAVGANALAFILAVGSGTIGGLAVKYLLDKRWIFYDRSTGVTEYRRRFTLYTVMGLTTTAIFWGTETIFWLIWKTQFVREIGAITGLTIGYFVKYHLDRRYVFTTDRSGSKA